MRSTAAGSLGRAFTAVAVSFALSLGYLTVEALPARAADTVTIPDSGLAACVGAAIPGYSGGSTFNTTDVAAITTLDCSNRSIASLAGAENLTGIYQLNLAGNAIRNVAPLAALPNLGNLDVSNNHIADISPLMDLSLTTFAAANQTLTWAVELNVPTTIPLIGLWGDQVATLVSLNPAKLWVSGGKVTGEVAGGQPASISFSDSTGGWNFSGSLVTTVITGGSSVAFPDAGFASCLDDALGVVPGSLFDLVGLRALTSLNCDNRGIRDLTGAYALENATAFSFANNDIYDVAPLDGMQNTATLNISGNHISDLSMLNIEFAAGINATGQTVSWTIPLSTPTAIPLKGHSGQVPGTLTSDSPDLTIADGMATGVNVGVHHITFSSSVEGRNFAGVLTTTADGGDVAVPDAGLAGCLQERLGVSGNVFGSLELAGITGTLDCSYRGITDLTGAQALTGLTALDLSHNSLQASDLTSISGLTSLSTLNLAANQLTGVAALATATGLKDLDLSSNQIADLSTLGSLSLTTLNATGQSLSQTVPAGEPTDVAIRDLSGSLPSFTLPSGVTVDADNKTVTAAAGVYNISFSSGSDPIVFSGTYALGSQMDVEIPQSNFAACVATSLDKPASTTVFSNLDLATIGVIACPRQGVASIDGVQYMTNLVYLDISGNVVTDLSPLAGLKALSSLDLRDNHIEDISALSGLTSVSNLYLSGNLVSSLSSLSGLTRLANLDVSENRLASLTGIGAMTSLLTLDASSNQLTSIAPIKTLARLTTLNLSDNQLTSLTDLASLPTSRLKSLTITRNQITSIGTLSRFTNLATVKAAGNKVTDLTPLTGLTRLLIVDFSNNKISSLNALAGHSALVGIYLSGNQLTSMAGLTGDPSLSSVEIYDNQIADLTPLAALPALNYANARNQHPTLAVYPTVATDLPLKDLTGAAPTLGTLPAGLSVDGTTVTADAEGSYDLPFSSTYDTETQTIEFSGALTVKATYNTFTTATPTITGTPKVDSTLTAHTGTWSPTPTFAYQWKADGVDIADATSSTFTPTAAEVGKAITVTVTGTKDTYAATPVTSAATEVVAQATFTSPDKVKVSGWYTVGETLTASATWTPTPGSVTYRWLRDDVPIEDATGATYTLTSADTGHAVAAQIAVTKAGYVNDGLTSSAKTVAEGVAFPDGMLHNCVIDALGKVALTYTNAELATLTSLDCSGRGIYDLSGMEALTGLTSLNLSYNPLSDLTPLSTLTSLTSLNLEHTTLTKLDGLGQLANLTTLDASDNALTDISAASTLTALTSLDLANNQLSSLSALSSLSELASLTASGNGIGDLTPLAGLSKLATRDVTAQVLTVQVEGNTATTVTMKDIAGALPSYDLPSGVSISDGKITAAAGLYTINFANVAAQEGDPAYFSGYIRLESHIDVEIADGNFAACLADNLDLPAGTFTFSNVALADLGSLDCTRRGIRLLDGAEYLVNAISLDLSRNTISDITPLAGLSRLVTVDLSENDLGSIGALAGKSQLQSVFLSGNRLTDLSALSGAASLRTLYVDNNRLTSLVGIPTAASYLTVSAAGNELTNMAPLASVARITSINVADNQLTNISELGTSAATSRLTTLDISGNRISSVSELSRFTKLSVLRAHDTQISNLAPLTGVKTLIIVDLANSQVSDLSALASHGNLMTLLVAGNQITDVSPLVGSPFLTQLDIFGNHVADLSPLATLSIGVLNARSQTISMGVVPQVAATVPLKDSTGSAPSLGALPGGLSIDSDQLTATAEGTYPVTFTSGDYATTSVEFSGTLTVTAAYNTFTTATPTITGTPKVDSTLTVHTGTWSPEPSFAYQWKADGTDITNATSTTFVPTAAEVGKAITVTVTGTKDTYAAASLTSAATQAVASGTFTAPSEIAVSGTFAVGQKVTASAGTWSPEGTISYQWLRNGSAIPDATNAEYTLTTDDAAKAVSVQVSATADGYTAASARSAATAVALGAMYGDKPLIVGTAAIGSTLQVGTGFWSPSPSFSLQWYRAGFPIEGAIDYTYEVTAADVGKAITVAQTGTVAGYAPLTKLSDPTGAVPSGTLSTSTGAGVDGSMTVGQTLTAQAGTWTPTPDSFSYQWRSDGDPISGATSSTYALSAADEGHVITVRVTAVKAGYTSASATSADEGAVAKGSFVTAVPTITGTPTFGHTLKATVGAWSPVATFDWQWLRNGSDINGATGSNYTLTTADIGKAISVRVVGSLPGYLDTPVTSEATAAVAEAAFTAPTGITVSGDQAVGKTLSILGASWTPTPDSVSYRWLRDGSAISGATSATYVLTAADLGTVITAEVTATKAGYTSSVVTSAAGDVVAANALAADVPVISGSPVVGATLTASSGGWSPTPTTLSYQWRADGAAIDGATNATFALTPAQAGAVITVTVTGEAAGYADKVITSSGTAKVALAELVGSTSVTVSGTAVVGSTLTASDVSWTPAPDSVVFQWLRGGVPIDGANDQAYVLTAADKGKVITVSVTATKDGYRTVTLHSLAADPVAAATFTADVPVITGSPVVDQTLTADFGSWAPVPSSGAIEWKRDGKVIDGATSDTYTVTSADAGSKITVSLFGSLDGYADHTVTSAATDTVTKATFTAPVSVTVSGTMQVGEFVTAQAGTWTPTPDSLSYQWLRDGDPIVGATSTSSYLLTSADATHVVTVTVTAIKAGYVDGALTSAAGDEVAAGAFVAPKPTVSGTSTVDRTLTASASAWTPSPSAISYQWLADGTPIEGATGLTYKLTAADMGKAITFAVTGSKAGYADATATSEATAAVAAASLTAPTAVTVSGDLVVGSTLSVDHGTWTPTPDSYSYRWLRNSVAIDNANKATYTLTADDLDQVITAEVTAKKAGYTDQALASTAGDAVSASVFSTDTPVISGSPVVAGTLTATSSGWSPAPTTLTYQWQADGADITDANQATFTLTPAEQGKAITVTVTGEAAGYADKTVTSVATEKVAAAELVGSTSVTVSGPAVVGSTLTASDVSWTPTPDSVVFQWLRGGVAIDGANDQSYVLTSADEGKVITVSVTATKDGYRQVVLTSVAAAPISPASFTADVPVITGSPVVGQTLTADFGNWTPVPSVGAVEWKRDGKVIDGAVSDTYLVTSADVGSKITVSLFGSLDGYADHTATSAATETVTKASFTAPASVTTSGTMQVGEFVTAQAGTWTPSPDSFSYQWLRDGDPIVGATSTSSYLLTPADATHVITVTVSAVKDGYTTASLTSAAGDEVAAGAFTAPKPSITGTPTVDETLTATASAWTPSPATISYQWLADGTPIEGATGLTYKVTAADKGKAIAFAVTGTKGGYAETTATSDATAVVAAATLTAPTSVDVTGDRVVGSTLSVDHGTWTPTPDSYSYRWLRNSVAIDNATKATYTLTAEDLGKTITAEVTASKAGYTDKVATSTDGQTIAAGQFATVSPWISGNALVGSTLTANVGYWSPEPSAYTYQWNADGEPILHATSSTFTVTQAQAGAVISLSVTGELSGYVTTTVNTGGTDPVPAAEFTAPSEIAVTGDFVVGAILTADAGTWSPVPTSLTYQWMRGATEITDAHGATYTLTPADKGKVVTVTVTATSQGYRKTILRSVAAEPVSPASFTAATPEITGTAAIGQTLTAEVGTWSPVPGETTLQWKRNGKVIDGATEATYTVGLDDATATLTVEVTGKTDGYADKTVASAATATIAAGQFEAPASVTVSGDFVVGSTLTADAGSWSPKPTLSYQWYRGATPIGGADKGSYTLTAADKDADVTVQVTGTAKGYTEVTIASVSAAPVVAGTIEVGSVAINGQAQVGRVLTAKPEQFSPTPTTWDYQWYRDGEPIPNATEASYQLGDDDNGHKITVKVTGNRDGYNATAEVESEAVEVTSAGHFSGPEVAEVTGDFQVGHTLTASAGSWSPMPDSFSYQWLRGGSPIEGATEATYVMTAQDKSKVITVKVTAKKAGYVDATVRSSAPAAVNPGSFATTAPTLGGVPQIGQTLSVDPGTWTPAATSVSYQWYRNGGAIPGANGSSYTVVAADVWTTISVNVTGARDGYAAATTTASATPVPQGVLAGPNPAISGKVKVKKTLKVVLGTWSPSPDTVTYQWYRNGKAIKKATKASYKLTKSDKGKQITVKVTVSKAGYATRALTSAKTAKVKK